MEENLQAIREMVEQRIAEQDAAAAGDGSGAEDPHGHGNNGIPSALVRQCIRANELGDGILYALLNRGQKVYNRSASEWYTWTGHYWALDVRDDCRRVIEGVVEKYLAEVMEIQKDITDAYAREDKTGAQRLKYVQTTTYNKVARLRTTRGRNACLEFARSCDHPLLVTGDEMDLNPWLLACKNGVINLESGRFRAGRQSDMITMASPVEWQGLDAPCPAWERTLLEIFSGNRELVEYLQRLLGYSMTGLTTEPVFAVLWGKGRNGKDTLLKTICRVMGPLSGPIQSEMLLSQRFGRSASGPSPDIMRLKGLRMAFASETDEGRAFSASRVKWLTGSGRLVGRNPNDKYETEFEPSHKLFLLTNSTPHASPDDFAFWERVHLIPFDLCFVNRDPVAPDERRANTQLSSELDKEGAGILAWLVRGCIEWQQHGLKAPAAVVEQSKEYRRREDNLAEFLEECCTLDDGAKTKATELYGAFSKWFEVNISKKGISQKKFGELMMKKFERRKTDGGYYHYFGVELSREGLELVG